VAAFRFGVLEDAAYESAEVTLQTGDWLAAFTDGVIEAENRAQQEYGEPRLLTMLSRRDDDASYVAGYDHGRP
jgi:phosphoserine phosphatase RsbU/P